LLSRKHQTGEIIISFKDRSGIQNYLSKLEKQSENSKSKFSSRAAWPTCGQGKNIGVITGSAAALLVEMP